MNGQTSTGEIAVTPTGLGAQVGACPAEPDGAEVWAVCCSGGGIRSASYCLGALQALEQSGFLAKAKLILGVSGGSYMAASRALVAHGLEVGSDPAGLPAYAPGSPADGAAAKLGPGQVVCPWASGTFARPAPAGTGSASTLVVCKLGWWTGAPWDVRAYAAGHPTYPADSTLEQLYDSAEFDAYRELGACSVKLAMAGARALVAATK